MLPRPSRITCICAVVACTAPFSGAARGGEPSNDDCADASPIGDGATPFSNAGASTDGPAPCDLLMGSDIWYEYIATCTGNWRVDTCGSSFDTVLGAYDGCGCPVGVLLDCNDDFDFCGEGGLQSILNVPVVAGNCYRLQVGGFLGAVGSGTITSSCTIIQCPEVQPACGPGAGDCCTAHAAAGCDDCGCCGMVCDNDPFCCNFEWDVLCAGEALAGCGNVCAPCPWDCGAVLDGIVDVVDFLALLGEWGAVGSPCDVDGAGVSVTDFLALLAAWGPCP